VYVTGRNRSTEERTLPFRYIVYQISIGIPYIPNLSRKKEFENWDGSKPKMISSLSSSSLIETMGERTGMRIRTCLYSQGEYEHITLDLEHIRGCVPASEH
jgi:hypothetical protein